MKVFLIGYMGSGKSRWGKKLAQKLGVDFIDLDKHIEQQEGKSISQIFEQQGEKAFRKIEFQALSSLLNRKNSVIATGGGTPCYNNNMELMNTHGTTVYLQADPGMLASRILNSKNKRPLVKNMDKEKLLSYIHQHLESRIPFYMQAHYVVDVVNLTISQLVKLCSSMI